MEKNQDQAKNNENKLQHTEHGRAELLGLSVSTHRRGKHQNIPILHIDFAI